MPKARDVKIGALAAVRERLRRKYRLSFYDFAKDCLGYDLHEHVHRELCELLQNAYRGTGNVTFSGGIGRVLALLPRGSYKSSIIDYCFVPWILIQNDPNPNAWQPPPSFNGKKGYNQRILIGSEIEANSLKFLATIKENLSNPLLVELYGDITPKGAKAGGNSRKLKWHQHGFNVLWRDDYKTRDFNVNITALDKAANSTHTDINLIDDLVGEAVLSSGAHNQATVDFYHRLLPIADNPSLMIFVGTPWKQGDLYDRFMNAEEEKGKWTILRKPAIRSDEEVARGAPRLLFPEVLSAEVLEDLRSTLPVSLFASWYLLEYVDQETALFKESYFQNAFYELPAGEDLSRWLEGKHIFTTADLAISRAEEACYTAIVTCAWDHAGHCWLLDVFNQRAVNPGAIINELYRHHSKWNPLKVGVEKEKIAQTLAFFMDQHSRSTGIWPRWADLSAGSRSKPLRISGLEPLAMDGKLHFREEHRFLVELMVKYPNCSTEDAIDALAYQKELAYMPLAPNNRERRSYMTVYPSDMDQAWVRHQRRLGIHAGKSANVSTGASWRQL